jgi:hypothetical protein
LRKAWVRASKGETRPARASGERTPRYWISLMRLSSSTVRSQRS